MCFRQWNVIEKSNFSPSNGNLKALIQTLNSNWKNYIYGRCESQRLWVKNLNNECWNGKIDQVKLWLLKPVQFTYYEHYITLTLINYQQMYL